MLGSSAIKNYINTSNSVYTKPRVFLEFNGNDYGQPYFCGTGDYPDSSFNNIKLTLSSDDSDPAPINSSQINSRGVSTAISGSAQATLLKVPYRNRSSDNSYYYAAYGPVGVRSAKFNMFLKSDYQWQQANGSPEYIENFKVVIQVYGVDASNNIVATEFTTKVVDVNSVDWTPVTVSFANPDDYQNTINRLKIRILIEPNQGEGVALLVSQLTCVEVSEYEVYVENRLPVSQVFNTMRPGEFMVDMPTASRPTVKVGDSTFAQPCSPMHMGTSYMLGDKYTYVQRSVLPFEGNPYSYYISGSDSESKKVWALYRNPVKTNKIVVKVNATVSSPSNFAIWILTSSGWQLVNTIATFDDSGLLVLRYDGAAWSNTALLPNACAKINPANGNINSDLLPNGQNYFSVYGIYFVASGMTLNNSDFTQNDKRLELVELSPRLEIEVTDYLQALDISSEIDSGDSVLPIGGLTSNSAKLTLSNIPIINALPDTVGDASSDIIPFSNFSTTSPVYGMLRKGVKVRGSWTITPSVTDPSSAIQSEEVPAFCMYVDEWRDNDFAIEVSAFDALKSIQSLRVRPVYLQGASVPEAIQAVLDPVGFGEYYFDDLRALRLLPFQQNSDIGFNIEDKIQHFWTSKENSLSEVLQDIFKVFQVGMYTDAYGAAKITSLYEYNQKFKAIQSGQSTNFTDVSDSSMSSVSLVERDRPQSITIKYKIPRVHISEPKADTTANKDQPLLTSVKQATQIIWSLKNTSASLPYLELTGSGINGIAQNYIPYDPQRATSITRDIPFSCDLLIDQEIVSYNGKEYLFSYKDANNSTVNKNITITKPEEIDMTVRSLMSKNNAKSITYKETGRLMNVVRGKYGTVPKRHNRATYAESSDKWVVRKFTKTDSGYKNGSTVSSPSKYWKSTEYGMYLACDQNDKVFFMHPSGIKDEDHQLRNKRNFYASFKIGDIPNQNDGYLGVGIGVTFDNGDIDNGLFLWFGVDSGKNKKSPVVWVEQVVGGEKKTLVAKDAFEYNEQLFNENENLDVNIAINEDRTKCMILVGGTSAFAKLVTVKEKPSDSTSTDKSKPTEEYKNFAVTLKRPLARGGTFGWAATNFGSGIMGKMMFGVSKKPEDMNNINVSNIPSPYGFNDKRPGETFYIGPSTLLDTIVNKELVPGFNNSSADNFTYTANPVARGIKVFEVDYDVFPAISDPQVMFLGYSYDINVYQDAPLYGSVPSLPKKKKPGKGGKR